MAFDAPPAVLRRLSSSAPVRGAWEPCPACGGVRPVGCLVHAPHFHASDPGVLFDCVGRRVPRSATRGAP